MTLPMMTVTVAEDWPSDPRLEALGQRTLMGKDDKPPAPDGEVESAPSEHRRWRIEHGVAEGDTEMPSGEVFVDVKKCRCQPEQSLAE